jgi:sulfite exporter TauE/SafE
MAKRVPVALIMLASAMGTTITLVVVGASHSALDANQRELADVLAILAWLTVTAATIYLNQLGLQPQRSRTDPR